MVKKGKMKTEKEIEKELVLAIMEILSSIKALDNKDRREILKQCYEKPKTISELKRILKSSNKVTYHNVKYLEKEGFVKLEKKEKEKHHPVYVSSYVTPSDILLLIEAMINVMKEEGEIS